MNDFFSVISAVAEHFFPLIFRHSMWNHTKIFSDFDDDSAASDGDYMNARTISRGGARSSAHHKSTASSLRWAMTLICPFFWWLAGICYCSKFVMILTEVAGIFILVFLIFSSSFLLMRSIIRWWNIWPNISEKLCDGNPSNE